MEIIKCLTILFDFPNFKYFLHIEGGKYGKFLAFVHDKHFWKIKSFV